MRVLYIVDDVRKLKLLGGSLTDGEVLVNSIDSTFAYRATMYNSGSSIQQLTNLLVRIFVGTTSGRYNSYYDFGVVPNNQENPELGTRKVPFARELYIEREWNRWIGTQKNR